MRFIAHLARLRIGLLMFLDIPKACCVVRYIVYQEATLIIRAENDALWSETFSWSKKLSYVCVRASYLLCEPNRKNLDTSSIWLNVFFTLFFPALSTSQSLAANDSDLVTESCATFVYVMAVLDFYVPFYTFHLMIHASVTSTCCSAESVTMRVNFCFTKLHGFLINQVPARSILCVDIEYSE